MTSHDAAPPFLGISHLALSSSDLAAARTFWTHVMGFEVFTDVPGMLFVGHRPTRVAIAVVDHGGGEAFDERRPGLDHLALAVPDAASLNAWQEHLAAHGVTHTPIVDSGAGLHLNLRAPGDLPIELYVMDDATAAAFGLDDPLHAYAGSRP